MEPQQSYHKSALKGRLTLALVCCILALLLSGCLTLYKHSAARDVEQKLKNGERYDAIIVPGIPFTGAHWGHLMKSRVIWSWILYKNGIAKNVIYSGAAVHTPYQEARVMGLYAEKLGIPREHIFFDTCAQHSTENVYYSYLIARKQGFRKVAVASDVYQCFFLRKFIRKKFDDQIAQLPLLSDTIAGYRNLQLLIDPSTAVIPHFETFVPLSEKENYFKRMKGTFGWNIDWNDPSRSLIE